ncbi:unnamed protein product, partial [Staurois parvus]
QVTSNDYQTCNETQYFKETWRKCCSRCPPGTYLKNECTETSDTECQPCEDGRYTSNWNYAARCMNCKSCDQPLIEKEKCTRTKKEQCGCPDGYTCTQLTGTGICLICKPDLLPTTVPLPTEPRVTQPSSDYPPWVIPVIVVVAVFIVLVTLSMIFLYRNKSNILEKLGCMTKVKKPLPESAGLEVNFPPPITQNPQQELRFPMEETDPLQSFEYAP